MKNGLPVPKTDKIIMGKSYIIMYKEPKNKANSQTVLDFFTWAINVGDKAAVELHYHPLTGEHQKEAFDEMSKINLK